MATIQIQRFGKNDMIEDYSKNISVKFCQNISSNKAINANFHFSHYKSMAITQW